MNDTKTTPTVSRTRIPVRWRDLDAYNHVNNSTYLTYLEEARLDWLKQVPGEWYSDSCAPVLAASTLNYRAPINWPAEIVVELHVERLGNSSLTIGHRIVDAEQGDTLYCDGNVVLVWMNPQTGQPVAVPDAIRNSIANS